MSLVDTFDGYINDQGGEVINITNPVYGAKGDTVLAARGGAIVAGTTAFTQSGYQFIPADAGKVVTIQGAGLEGAVLATKITAVLSATTATLAHPALTTVTDAGFSYGTDDTHAMVTAIDVASWWGTIFAPAGIYTILGASNTGDNNGGAQLHLASRGGLLGQGGKFDPSDRSSRANTIFLCGDANAGLMFSGHARYEGFLVDGNNIATAPIKTNPVTGSSVVEPPGEEPLPTGGLPTGLPTGTSTGNGVHYSRFADVWSSRSAANGWWIFGSQNLALYDCGVVDSAQDGLYFDFGTGGHDFFNFYERGSLRYGLHGDTMSPGGGFIFLPGDVNFFGGTFDTHPTRRGVSKIFLRSGIEWGFYDMDIVGDNLSGPTIALEHALNESHVVSRCRIWATPKGTNLGGAGIHLGGPTTDNGRQWLFLKTDGCAFMSGDNSVYVSQNNALLAYTARGWVMDATEFGPASAGALEGDTSVPQVTMPGPAPLLHGRTGGWQEAALVSPWTGSVQYRIMAEGWVQLKGRAQSPAGAAGRMFVLPIGYRHREGAPVNFLVAVSESTGASIGVGRVTVQNGDPSNANAGAVMFTPIAGSGPYDGGTTVYLDGAWLPVRSTTGHFW